MAVRASQAFQPRCWQARNRGEERAALANGKLAGQFAVANWKRSLSMLSYPN
jgi:hypothetical protein